MSMLLLSVNYDEPLQQCLNG